MDAATFRKMYGRDGSGLGGAVNDGDARHPEHSRLVRECGTWLNAQHGVLVWATATGRFTGRGVYGTPGVADIVGWKLTHYPVFGGPPLDERLAIDCVEARTLTCPRFLAVECKVGKDELSPAQKSFREEAEAAGVLYFVARWDGESPDPALDLREQWKQGSTLFEEQGDE